MFHIALYEPEIPPNTGNIIRLCANTGTTLHLIEPLGFSFEDKLLQRAGLDYREWAQVQIHDSYRSFRAIYPRQRIFALSTKGKNRYADVNYKHEDILLFGPESRGLPAELLAEIGADHTLRIPMYKDSRSLNLSNAVAVIVYEGLRQLEFPNLN